jgi:phage tail-like protein
MGGCRADDGVAPAILSTAVTQLTEARTRFNAIVPFKSLLRLLRRLFMNYPLPRNHFSVDWGGARIGFSEVCGLTIDAQAPAFRDGATHENSNVTMPGILRYPHLVLKRTVQKSDNDFYAWINTIQLNTVDRREVTVSLLDASNAPVVVWTFRNAFPVKLEYSPLESDNSGPMMEILEIAHEGMTVQNS